MKMQLQYGRKFNTLGAISAQQSSGKQKQRCLSVKFYTFADGEEVMSRN